MISSDSGNGCCIRVPAGDPLGEKLAAARRALASLPASPAPPMDKEAGADRPPVGYQFQHGLTWAIEYAKGDMRKGRKCTMAYGFIQGTKAGDGGSVDFWMEPEGLGLELFFIVNQKAKDGSFDECKVIVGCKNEEEAREKYLENYPPDLGPKLLGSIRPMTLPEFKEWLRKGDMTKAASDLGIVIDRPKGYKKTFYTQAGSKELEYPLDYGYFKGVINPEDDEDADVFIGTGGNRHGRFMKGRPAAAGGWEPDERKWYANLSDAEYQALKGWWDTQHDPGVTWDWTDLPDAQAVRADASQVTIPSPPMTPPSRTVTTLVPRSALDSVRKHGLLGGQALVANPEALAAAAKGRGTTPEAFKADIANVLAGWKKYQAQGPNVFFHAAPEGTRLSDKHPSKLHDLASVKVKLDDLLRDVPETRLYGMELEPYDPKKHVKGTERHRYLKPEDVDAYLKKTPEELWKHYADPKGVGYYAPDVPHASIHTPDAAIPAKYLDFGDPPVKQALDIRFEDGTVQDCDELADKMVASLKATTGDKEDAKALYNALCKRLRPLPPGKPSPEGERPFTLAVDLDGTLAEQEEPFKATSIGPPRPKAKKWLTAFREAGARIIIFTVRGNVPLVEGWLKKHAIPYDHVNENPDQPPDSSGKVYADAYWDDRAYNGKDLDEHGPALLSRAKSHKPKEKA